MSRKRVIPMSEEEHRAKAREYAKRYYAKPGNKEKHRQYYAEYFADPVRKEKQRETMKRYFQTETGQSVLQRQIESGYYTYGKGAIANLKAGAEARGIRFSLTQQSLEAWWKGTEEVCEYCQISVEEYMRLRDIVVQYDGYNHQIHRFKRVFKTTKQQKISRLTLDRKDNCRGYEIGNLAKACWFCNNIKSDFFTAKEMKAMMPRIIAQLQQAIREEETSCFYVPKPRKPESLFAEPDTFQVQESGVHYAVDAAKDSMIEDQEVISLLQEQNAKLQQIIQLMESDATKGVILCDGTD